MARRRAEPSSRSVSLRTPVAVVPHQISGTECACEESQQPPEPVGARDDFLIAPDQQRQSRQYGRVASPPAGAPPSHDRSGDRGDQRRVRKLDDREAARDRPSVLAPAIRSPPPEPRWLHGVLLGRTFPRHDSSSSSALRASWSRTAASISEADRTVSSAVAPRSWSKR